MEKGKTGFKAIVVGSSISILGTLLIVIIAVLAAGHKAFDITMHAPITRKYLWRNCTCILTLFLLLLMHRV